MHAVKTRRPPLQAKNVSKGTLEEVDEESISLEATNITSPNKPFSQTLVDLQLEHSERENIADDRKYHLKIQCTYFSKLIKIKKHK